MRGASFMSREPSPAKVSGYRLQWSVRGLLSLTTVCAVALAVILAPRIRERATIDWLKGKHAPLQTETFGPNWLRIILGDRYLQHVVSVDLRKCDISEADLARLASLPRLRGLALRGSRVQVNGVERMWNRLRDVTVDVLPADGMYRRTMIGRGRSVSEAVAEFQMSAQWKMGWADSHGTRSDQLAVRRQFLHSLEELGATADAAIEPITPVERTLLEAAIAEARMELTSVAHSRAGIESACGDAQNAADALVQRLDEAITTGIDPFTFHVSRELATRLLLRRQTNEESYESAAAVLARAATQAEQLTRRVEQFCRSGKPAGGWTGLSFTGVLPPIIASEVASVELAVCKVDLALARARVARACGDSQAELHALRPAAGDAAALRKSAEVTYNPLAGATIFNLLAAHQRAAELEIALARAEGDQTAEQAARDRWSGFLAERRQLIACDSMGSLILSCYSVVLQYEQQGAAIFEQPVAELGIPQH